MNGIVILLIVIGAVALLGRWAVAEGQRIEQQKKFMRNMNNFDKNKPNGDKIRLMDMSRAKSYGFKPKVSLKEGLYDTVKYYQEFVKDD